MKLAILGTDDTILQLAAAARNAGHQIVWRGDIRVEDKAVSDKLLGPATDRSSEWELLLDQGFVDAVLVGRGKATGELRAEQLKRLTAAAVPLLTIQPVLDSVLPYYEIDMSRRETGALVLHYNPMVNHPAAARMAEWGQSGYPQLGTIHQLVCERRFSNASRAIVLAELVRDLELMAAIAGPIRRVSAVGPASPDASFASLQVQMTATTIPSLRWSAGTTLPSSALVQFVLVGDRGTVALRESRENATGETMNWQIETTIDNASDAQSIEMLPPQTAAINRLAEAVAETDVARRSTLSTWEAATRAMEAVDAIELSLQKGRTTEVFQQQLTEGLAFRGTMAALGCGLLLIAFVVVLAVAVLGGAEGIMQEKIAPSWPLLMLAVLAVFLLLQAVPLLVTKRAKSDPSHHKS